MIDCTGRGIVYMLIELLRKKEGFTEIEQQLADQILRYGEEFGWVPIRELADLCYTSTASVQRFCKKLGCESYKDMKIRYLNEFSKGNNELSPVDVNRPFHFGAQPSLIADKLCKVYSRAVQTTMEQLDYDMINRCADLIRSADILLLYGVGDSGITARSFMNRLIKIGRFSILAGQFGEDVTMSMSAGRKCLGMFITYRGGSAEQIQCAKILKHNHVPFAVLSSDVKTYITDNADVWIKVPSLETQSDNIATFFSQECFSFCLNLIYSVVYTRNYIENSDRKKSIDRLSAGGLLRDPVL